MGNSAEMIFRHYRQVVSPNEAERFWSIAPNAAESKIVTLAAA